ncbi:MAG: AAA family ATPase, partial [Rhizobiales bacterium]|nr:AAA family ATPase [Rhizobacter sp.]
MLAYLALEGPTPRARLATLLWPETDRERARTSLRQRHFRLRRLLGFDPLRQGETTALVAGLLTDLGPGDPEDAATDFAPLLGSFEWSGSGEAGAWLARARAHHAGQRLDALRAAAAEHEAQGRLAAAICVAQRLLAADALSEHAHRRLMRLHYLRGDRAAAIAAFEHCERVLKDELGTPPGAETLSLLRTVETSGSDMAVLPRGFVPVSVLRPPRLVGRDQELRRLALAWESDQAFCLIGEAGMGKSRLLAEFAASRGDVVCVQARPGDAAIPYAMMARTLRAVRAHADGTETTAPAGALVALLPELAVPGTPDGAPDRHALQQAIERLLAGARGRGLGGVLIDDLHFADEPSVSMLSTLIGFDNLGGLSLGMARRPSETAPAALALSDAGAETRCVTEVNLAPLDAAQLAELLASLDLPGLDVTHWVPLLARHTGGNPLFALETIKALTLETTGFRPGAGRLPIPSTIGALIAQRLKRLSSEALALARVAAVAGIDFCSALAEDVLEARAVDLASPWVELESAYVLRDEKFAHDLVYDAVLATIPPAVARRMHGAVAQYLEHHPGEPARVAEHWLGAGRAPAAVPWLERAAQDALKAFERPAAAG